MTIASRPPLPRAIWVLGGVSLLMDVASELIHSMLPVYLAVTLGVSALAIGLLEGVAEATALIVKVFSGTLSDWWGRRKPLAVLGYGLGAASKPLFALAGGVGLVVAARLIDRIGKGIRGAPRDALVADLTPREIRGAAYGLRQALDTVGAFLGPLLALGLMLLLDDDIRAVFWIACVPAAAAVLLLAVGIDEPDRPAQAQRVNPLRREQLARLPRRFWQVVAIGAAFTLARFSEAFLVLRAQVDGLPLAWTPLVLIVMNVVFAAGAYPLGRLADAVPHRALLVAGLVVLLAADLALARGGATLIWLGIGLWGLHLALTQGLLATMVADTVPADLRGTGFGVFNLASGGALLVASALAGGLWDALGPQATFLAGAGFCALTLAVMAVVRGGD